MHLDLDMGKYAVFVWGGYGVTFVALSALVIVSLRAQAVRRRRLEALQQAVEDKR
mgnify:CR=1 FL=1